MKNLLPRVLLLATPLLLMVTPLPGYGQTPTPAAPQAEATVQPPPPGTRSPQGRPGAARVGGADRTDRVQRALNPAGWRGRISPANLAEVPAEALIAHAWWNAEPLKSKLALTPAQRTRMDEALRRHLETLHRMAKEPVASEAFLIGLETGDLKTARQKVKSLEAAAADSARSAAEMKLAVVEALSTEQRTTLLEARPRILRTNWGQQANAVRLRHQRRQPQKPQATTDPL